MEELFRVFSYTHSLFAY